MFLTMFVATYITTPDFYGGSQSPFVNLLYVCVCVCIYIYIILCIYFIVLIC
jgi:hypothetical protein